jgi:hypothetical protein
VISSNRTSGSSGRSGDPLTTELAASESNFRVRLHSGGASPGRLAKGGKQKPSLTPAMCDQVYFRS